MTFPEKLLLRAQWGGRVDSMSTQIDMVWQTMQRLARYGDFLADPWHSIDTEPDEDITISGFNELVADMNRIVEHKGDYFYSYTTQLNGLQAPPGLTLRVSPSGHEGDKTMAANTVIVYLASGLMVHDNKPIPVRWLLSLGAQLVTDLVDIWHPDAVSLDSDELLDLKSLKDGIHPIIGYMSWLSPAVADPIVLPEAPVKQPYQNGLLYGIDLKSDDPVGDATTLAKTVYDADLVSMIPFIQGQPNPT
jgi:hypothetical protein